jgi:hypothetical protein
VALLKLASSGRGEQTLNWPKLSWRRPMGQSATADVWPAPAVAGHPMFAADGRTWFRGGFGFGLNAEATTDGGKTWLPVAWTVPTTTGSFHLYAHYVATLERYLTSQASKVW